MNTPDQHEHGIALTVHRQHGHERREVPAAHRAGRPVNRAVFPVYVLDWTAHWAVLPNDWAEWTVHRPDGQEHPHRLFEKRWV